eukprot:2428424-Pleurochrysis_carterae.AAC.1
MPGSDPNQLAHQQPLVGEELPGFDPNHQITAPAFFILQDAEHVRKSLLVVDSGDHACRWRLAF